MSQFRLPDLGEGLEEAQVVQWLVRVGDRVQLNQTDLPGRDGQGVGRHPVAIRRHGAAASRAAWRERRRRRTADHHRRSGAVRRQAPQPRSPTVMVPSSSATARMRHAPRSRASRVASRARWPALPAPRTTPIPRLDAPTPALSGADIDRASPLVRKIAAERGIDLSAIAGTGPGGRIRVEDLEARTEQACVPPWRPVTPVAQPQPRTRSASAPLACARPSPRAWCAPPRRSPLHRILALRRRRVSWRSATGSEGDRAYAESKLTFLPFFVRAVVEAVEGLSRSSTRAGTRRATPSSSSAPSPSASRRTRRAACWCRWCATRIALARRDRRLSATASCSSPAMASSTPSRSAAARSLSPTSAPRVRSIRARR